MTLFQRVVAIENLYDAWRTVHAKSARQARMKPVLSEYADTIGERLAHLSESLKSGSFCPEPNQQFYLQKSNKPGEYRELRVPHLEDRIVQQAIKNKIEPVLEQQFLDCSYAYRAGRGAHRAIRRVRHELNVRKAVFGFKSDIDDFFNTIDHGVLVELADATFKDSPLRELLELYLKNGLIAEDGVYLGVELGVPTGSILAPLLANLYLNELDRFMITRKHGYVRYADDFLVFGPDRTALIDCRSQYSEYLTSKLKLRLNEARPEPLHIDNGFPFVGFLVQKQGVTVLPEKLRKIKETLNQLKRDTRFWKFERFLSALEEKATGWYSYYGVSDRMDDHLEIEKSIWNCLSRALSDRISKHLIRNPEKEIQRLLAFPMHKTSVAELIEQTKSVLKNDSKASTPTETKRKTQSSKGSGDDRTRIETKLSRQRRVYEKAYIQTSEVSVWSPNTNLSYRNKRMYVRRDGKKVNELLIDRIRHVLIESPTATLTSGLMCECGRSGIRILFMDEHRDPCAVLVPIQKTDVELLKQQLKVASSPVAVVISKEIIEGKIRNQMNLLKYFCKTFDDYQDEFVSLQPVIESMESHLMDLPNDDSGKELDKKLEHILQVESRAAIHYWSGVRQLVKGRIEFPKRDRKGAKDAFNQALNYGYGILYGRITMHCMGVGLNPAIGFFHRPMQGKPALAFDLIEEFRAFAVDRVVIAMVRKGESIETEKGRLSRSTCRRVAGKVLSRLGSRAEYRGESISLEQVIIRQIESLKRAIVGEETYRAFTARW